MNTEEHPIQTRLRIGAVSRLTGLSVHALRKWEERYAAVEPHRTPGGERLYTRVDVQRLALIKRLTQSGAPLSEIARSPLETLERIAASLAPDTARPVETDQPVAVVRVGVVGAALPALLQALPRSADRLEIVACVDTVGHLRKEINGGSIDLLVQEFPTLQGDVARDVARSVLELGAVGGIVVYGFGARATLDTLRKGGFGLMRAPIDPAELQHVALGLMQQLTARPAAAMTGKVDEANIPQPRFSREAVARVAMSTPAMRCECPHHLADIVSNLLAFERYSIECENRNREDAALHRFLAVTAGRARSGFEEALVRVADAEGIDLSDV